MDAGEKDFGLGQLDAECQPPRRREIEDLARAVWQIENELIEVQQGRVEVPRIEFLLQLLADQPLGIPADHRLGIELVVQPHGDPIEIQQRLG